MQFCKGLPVYFLMASGLSLGPLTQTGGSGLFWGWGCSCSEIVAGHLSSLDVGVSWVSVYVQVF